MDDSSDKTISLLIPEEEEVTENVSVSPESTSSSSVDQECLICFYSLKKKYTENDDNGDNSGESNNSGVSNTGKGNNELDICICPFCATTFHSYCIYHWKKSQKGKHSGCPKCQYMGVLHYVMSDTKYRILESGNGSESGGGSERRDWSEEGERGSRDRIRHETEINIEHGSATVTDRSCCRDCNFSSTLERTCCVIVFFVIIFAF